MLTIVHASDLHFGRPHRPDVAEAFLEAAREAQPDIVVIAGDLTQRAKVREYEAASSFLARLPDVPRVVVPGNHDVPLYRFGERVLGPYRNYRRFVSRELDSVTRTPDAVVVAWNSTAPHRRVVNGRVRSSQLDLAADAFDGAPARLARVVVVHHPPVPAPDPDVSAPLPRARRVLEACARMRVDIVLSGHVHRSFVSRVLDAGSDDPRDGTVIAVSGSASSSRGRGSERGRNSFNVLRLDGDHVRVDQQLHDARRDRFESVSRHVFPMRGRAGSARAAQAPVDDAADVGELAVAEGP